MNRDVGIRNPIQETEMLLSASRDLIYDPFSGALIWGKDIPIAHVKGITEAGSINRVSGYRELGRTLFFDNKKKKVTIKAHRLAWFMYYGKVSEFQIDHINGNKSDNRIENLRSIHHDLNVKNSIHHINGKLWGAAYHPQTKTYYATFKHNKKRYGFGYYKTREEASLVSMEKYKEIGIQITKGSF